MAGMFRAALFASTLGLVFAGVPALAQGVAPGGSIGGSTGIGSGLGGVIGTGPSWPNGTNQAPQPPTYSVPPGGSPSPAPAPGYTPPPISGGSAYRQPNEPFPASSVRPPATVPLVLPAQPDGGLAFVRGCWRTDNFAYGQHRGAITWCFDDKGVGRYLYARTDQANVFFCHAQAKASWNAGALEMRAAKAACDDGSADAPADLTCRSGTEGALCTSTGQSWTVRLFRVR